jgi:MoxR-like ATPase
MQERTVTIDGTTHALPPSFTVMATQNSIENEGTYPLPEAQLDRFLFKLDVGYPAEADEVQAVLAHCGQASMPDLDAFGMGPVLDRSVLQYLWTVPHAVRIEYDVAQYIVALARASREHPAVHVGLSPRAASMLAAAARANAACAGRNYTLPDDVKELLAPVGRHRLVLHPEAQMEGIRPEIILTQIASTVPAPR